MTERAKNIIMFWVLIGAVLLVALAIMRADDAKAGGIGYSRDGWEGPIPFATDVKCDSAIQYWMFGYPTFSLVRDTVVLYPELDSTQLYASEVSLDSLGRYRVITVLFPKGGELSYILDISSWHHEGPGRIVPASPSGSYICRIYGYLSDLHSGYFSGAIVTGKQEAMIVYDTCSEMLVAAKTERYGPTGSNGYWYLDLIRSSCIDNQKYVITVSRPRLDDVFKRVLVPDSATYYYKWGK